MIYETETKNYTEEMTHERENLEMDLTEERILNAQMQQLQWQMKRIQNDLAAFDTGVDPGG